MTLHFEIVSPEATVFKSEAQSVSLPTELGEITVLPNHIPLTATLRPGIVTVRGQGKEQYLATSGGFIQVQKENHVIVLADTAERAEDLTEQAVNEAYDRAAKLLQEKRNVEDVTSAAAVASLERELARLRVVRKHRGKTGVRP